MDRKIKMSILIIIKFYDETRLKQQSYEVQSILFTVSKISKQHYFHSNTHKSIHGHTFHNFINTRHTKSFNQSHKNHNQNQKFKGL